MKPTGEFAVGWRDVQDRFVTSGVVAVLTMVLVGGMNCGFGAPVIRGMIVSGTVSILVSLFFIQSSRTARWTVLHEGDHLSGKTRLRVFRPILPRRSGRYRTRFYVGGKKALLGYSKLRLALYSAGRSFEEIRFALETLPPSQKVLDLVNKEKVTDPVMIHAVLDGEIPVEWGGSFSSGPVVE